MLNRRTVTRTLAACLATAALATASACGSSDSPNAESSSGDTPGSSTSETSAGNPEPEFTVGFSNPTAALPLLKVEQDAFTAEAERLGMKVISLDAGLNVSKQVGDINQLLAQEVDGIVVLPLANDSLGPALEKAKDAGVKVVGIEAIPEKPADMTDPASVAPYDSVIAHELNYTAAEQVAELTSEALGGTGNVLIVGLGIPVPNVIFQMDQWQSYLEAAAPDVNIVGQVDNPTDDIAGAQRVVSEAITKYHGEIDGVLAYSDNSAIGAAVALKNAGIEPKVIVGAGGSPVGIEAVESGQITANVEYPPWLTGLVAAHEMYRLLTDQPVPPYVLTESPVWTADNLSERLDWDQALADIKSGELTCSGDNTAGCPDGVAAN